MKIYNMTVYDKMTIFSFPGQVYNIYLDRGNTEISTNEGGMSEDDSYRGKNQVFVIVTPLKLLNIIALYLKPLHA